MNIALITTNLRGGGAEKNIIRLAEAFHKRGHRVALVLLEHMIEHAISDYIAVHALTQRGKPLHKGFIARRIAALRLRRLLNQLAPDNGFDLLLSTLPFADEVVALANLPKVWFRIANTLSAELQSLSDSNPKKAMRRKQKYLRVYQGQNLLAVSDGVAEDLYANLGLTRSQIVRIYNPFDFAAIRRLATAASDALPTAPYIIHVGRFMRQKRHDVLLQAYKQASLTHKLVLLTHPSDELTALIAANGLQQQVIVAGFQANPYPWIKHAALLVLSSEREGMPNVLVEALVCGTPVVSTDCPSGPREVLQHSLLPYLVPMNDSTALAAAMQAALRSYPPITDTLLEKFDAQHVLAEYEDLPARWRPKLAMEVR